MVGAQLGAIYLPPFQHLLGTDALGLVDLATVFAASTITFFAIEAQKLFRRRRISRLRTHQ
jgi:O-antigen/teichoic acid export membrane protein